MKRTLVVVALLTAIPAPAWAADRRVPEQFATIQEAVDAASPDDRIIIAPGPYYENVTVAKDGLRFVGKKVVLDGTLENGSTGTALDVTGNRITVEGITFRNGGTNLRITGDGAVVRKCVFTNADGYGVEIAGSGAVVDRCSFFGASSDSVYVSGADAKVSACRIVNAGDGGVYVSGAGALVERCVVQNTVDDPGIEVSGNGARVIGNRVSSCDSEGIDVTGADARVEANVVTATDSTGIDVSGNNPTVVRNRVSNVSGEDDGIGVGGAEVPGGLVERNVVIDTTEDGIDVNVPGATIRNNLVQRVGGEDDAGYSLQGDGIVAEGNRAIDCDSVGFLVRAANVTLRRCSSVNASRSGFEVSEVPNVLLDGCSATGSGIAGIENYGTSTTVKGSKFLGNRRDVTNNGTYAEFVRNTFRTGGTDVPVTGQSMGE